MSDTDHQPDSSNEVIEVHMLPDDALLLEKGEVYKIVTKIEGSNGSADDTESKQVAILGLLKIQDPSKKLYDKLNSIEEMVKSQTFHEKSVRSPNSGIRSPLLRNQNHQPLQSSKTGSSSSADATLSLSKDEIRTMLQ